MMVTLQALLQLDLIVSPEFYARRPVAVNDQIDFVVLDSGFNCIFGFVDTLHSINVFKLVSRISKDNVVINSKNIEIKDSFTQTSQKTIFLILTLRTQENFTYNKIMKALLILDFIFIDNQMIEKRHEHIEEQKKLIQEMSSIVMGTKREIVETLEEFTKENIIEGVSYFNTLKFIFEREYNFGMNLKYVNKEDSLFNLLVWIPKLQFNNLVQGLDAITSKEINFVSPKVSIVDQKLEELHLHPPTSFHSNVLIESFQEMTNIYGVPRYKEINPAVFSIVSFSFMFGLMFGDIGHGLCLFVIALFIYNSKDPSLKNFQGYSLMLVIMGFFAIFCGFVYNEFFSIPMITQSSCFQSNFKPKTTECVYTFGLDWIWSISNNETAFVNSFKMKFAIIIGVTQMIFGLVLKILNNFHFSNYLDLFTETIPQLVFMTLIFGYMVFCIFIKWILTFSGRINISIIQMFINLTHVDTPLLSNRLTQEILQKTFLAISIFCLCIMLLVKPIWKFIFKKSSKKQPSSVNHDYHDIQEKSNLLNSVG